MEITGQIYRIDPVVESNGHKIRTFVIYVHNQHNEQYSDFHQFELFADKCAIIDMYQVGQTVKVGFNLRGRKFQKKDGTGEAFFTSLSAFAIVDPMQVMQMQQTQQMQRPQMTPGAQYQNPVIPGASPQQAGYAQMMGQPQQPWQYGQQNGQQQYASQPPAETAPF